MALPTLHAGCDSLTEMTRGLCTLLERYVVTVLAVHVVLDHHPTYPAGADLHS
jgi:hypothetical protein